MTYFEERRSEKRTRTCLHAFASDLDEKIEVKCVVRDISRSGCKLVSRDIQGLPSQIRITAEGFAYPICGQIVWRKDNMVGVSFTEANTQVAPSGIEVMVTGFDVDETDNEILLIQEKERPPSFWSRMQKFISIGRFLGRIKSFLSNWSLLFSAK